MFKPPFIIKIDNYADCVEIQKLLFNQGYRWRVYKQQLIEDDGHWRVTGGCEYDMTVDEDGEIWRRPIRMNYKQIPVYNTCAAFASQTTLGKLIYGEE